jgi:putative flavoprotein involved in K+ transport
LIIDRHPDSERAVTKTNHYMTGRDGGHEIDLRKLRLERVSHYGSLVGFSGTQASFLPDLG